VARKAANIPEETFSEEYKRLVEHGESFQFIVLGNAGKFEMLLLAPLEGKMDGIMIASIIFDVPVFVWRWHPLLSVTTWSFWIVWLNEQSNCYIA
jgi:hypothetical protein